MATVVGVGYSLIVLAFLAWVAGSVWSGSRWDDRFDVHDTDEEWEREKRQTARRDDGQVR